MAKKNDDIAPSTIPARPEWLPHRYDPGYDAVQFVLADRTMRASIPFLTDENLPAAASPVVLKREDSIRFAAPPAPIHFIFHSAYCCSTLLGNAFDQAGIASTLKEPVILNDLVGWRHRGASPELLSRVLNDSLGLLARPFETGEAMIVKPSNVVNALAPAMLTMRPEAGCLLLYAPLPVYLASIASKGLWGRLWVRDLLFKQLKEGMVDLGFQPEDYFLQSDLQVAAVGWLAQHRLFADMARRWPERVRTLDSETLLAQPENALNAIGNLFGLPLAEEAIGAIVGKAFKRHAKFGGDFDQSDRKAGQRAAADIHKEEIEKVQAWAEATARSASLSLDLPGRLLAA